MSIAFPPQGGARILSSQKPNSLSSPSLTMRTTPALHPRATSIGNMVSLPLSAGTRAGYAKGRTATFVALPRECYRKENCDTVLCDADIEGRRPMLTTNRSTFCKAFATVSNSAIGLVFPPHRPASPARPAPFFMPSFCPPEKNVSSFRSDKILLRISTFRTWPHSSCHLSSKDPSLLVALRTSMTHIKKRSNLASTSSWRRVALP